MNRELRRAGIGEDERRAEFFNAIRPEAAGPFPSVGARGCFLSHLGVLEDASRRGHDAILVCEDDLSFTRDIMAMLRAVCAGLASEDWSIFYGGHELSLPSEEGPIAEIPPPVPVRTAHCIGFRGETIREAARYLSEMLERPAGSPEGGPMHVDGAYSWYRASHPHRRTLAAVPPVGYQRASRSDIVDDLKWYDRIPAFELAVHALRRLKRMVVSKRK